MNPSFLWFFSVLSVSSVVSNLYPSHTPRISLALFLSCAYKIIPSHACLRPHHQ